MDKTKIQQILSKNTTCKYTYVTQNIINKQIQKKKKRKKERKKKKEANLSLYLQNNTDSLMCAKINKYVCKSQT